jgi:hypothetical protein
MFCSRKTGPEHVAHRGNAMTAETQIHHASIGLIVTRQRASEVLLSVDPACGLLPRLTVFAGDRITKQLVAAVNRSYRLDTYCLFIQKSTPACETTSLDAYAVMDAIPENDNAPPDMRWYSSAEAISKVSACRDREALRSSLDEIERYTANPGAGPFGRPACFEELFSWVEGQIKPLGLGLTGRFQQFTAGPTFSLVRIETTGVAVWFKATGEPNLDELPLSIALHELFPNYVPSILGVHASWNGWLSQEIPGRTLADFSHIEAWIAAAQRLGELQVSSVAKIDALLKSGCRDLRLRQIADQIEPFLTRMSDLMAIQIKQTPPALSDSEIGFLGDRLKAAVSQLRQQPVPCTLGHLDFNPRNIIVSSARCRFLDWAEGCVTHPLLTFEYLCEHARRSLPQSDVLTDKLLSAYVEPWQALVFPGRFAPALEVSPLVAVYAYAVAGNKWHSSEAFENPKLAGYFRSLTRRAYREATRIAARRAGCLTS